MFKAVVCVCFVLLTLGSLVPAQDITDTVDAGWSTDVATSSENFDVCSSISCGTFSTCVGLDDGSYTCFCDVEIYTFLCGGTLRLCDANDCNNAAQCEDAPDGSTLCSCLPGTEGDRCQYFTKKLGGSVHEIQTRVTDGSKTDGVPWSRDVCWRVPVGQSVEIDIGRIYAVSSVKVVVFSDGANLTLRASTGPGDTNGQLCTRHAGFYTIGASRTFPCSGLSTRFLRLDVHRARYISSTSFLMCVGGVVRQDTRTAMTRYVPQSGRQQITTLESPSVIHCAVTCMEHGRCVTFTWDSNLCYLYENFDVCSSISCGTFSTCLGLDDGSYTCFCDVEIYTFLCGGTLRLCDANDCNNAAQCEDAPDGSTLCSCLPGTEGDRCQYFTKKLGGSVHEIQTRVTDGSKTDGVPWSRDVCWRVPVGQSVEIDIGRIYAVSSVKVVVFSDGANLTLRASTGPGDTNGQLCTRHAGFYTIGASRTFPCSGLSTRFLRLDVHRARYISSTSFLMCVGGVVRQDTRTAMTRYVPQSGRQQITTLESPSVIHCAVTCMEHGRCVTFTWDSNLCYLYESNSAISVGSGFEAFSLTRTETTEC